MMPNDPIAHHFNNGIHFMSGVTEFQRYKNGDVHRKIPSKTLKKEGLNTIIMKIKEEILLVKKFKLVNKNKTTVAKVYTKIKYFIKVNISRLPKGSLIRMHFGNTLDVLSFSEKNLRAATESVLEETRKKAKAKLEEEVTVTKNIIAKLK